MKRTALIPGGTSEIGESIISRFVDRDVNCVITARRSERLAEIVARYEGRSANLLPISADMTVETDRARVVEETHSRIGGA